VRQPESGSVRWYDAANEPRSPSLLRGAVACVTQEDSPMMGTIEENITFFAEHPDLQSLQRAAELAELEREIASMPLQYRTQVGPQGCNLSGGQRQRLLLARALYTESRTLLIDEGTTELDSATEAKIFSNLRGHGLTLVVVAHRQETLRLADRILRLENGAFSEDGRRASAVSVTLTKVSGISSHT
jgi:ATP-binding cassette, subfamily B, bacterial CvaB/MchF/RaxB